MKYLEKGKIKNDKVFRLPDPLPSLKEMEEILINEALKRSDGNQTIAAQLLKISRRALNNRMQRNRS